MNDLDLVKLEQERISKSYPQKKYFFYAGKVAELLPRATPLSFGLLEQIYAPGKSFHNVMENLEEDVTFPNGPLLDTFMGKVYINLEAEKQLLYKNQPLKYKIRNNDLQVYFGLSLSNFYREIPSVFIKVLRDSVRIKFVDKFIDRCAREYEKLCKMSDKVVSEMKPITIDAFLEAYESCIYIAYLHNFYYLWNRQAAGRDPFEKKSAGVYARVNNYLIRDDGDLFRDNKYKSVYDFELMSPRYLETKKFGGTKTVPCKLEKLPHDLDIFDKAEVLLACLRDNSRLKILPFLYYLRVEFLRVSEKYGLGDGVFFHTLSEINELMEMGRKPDASVISRRLEIYNAGDNIFLPNFLTPENIHKVGFDYEKTPVGKEYMKQGISCAPGFVRGKVQYIHSTSDKVTGEILAFDNASPAYTHFYKRAHGLLFEMGSPLSHGAIIARELDIPAVALNVMMEDLDKKVVEVDGSLGQVLIPNY